MSMNITERLQRFMRDYGDVPGGGCAHIENLAADALAEIMALEARNEYCQGRLADLQAKYDLALETLSRMNTLAAGG